MTDTARRPDEEFDTQMDVERNPCEAWQAIQHLAAEVDRLRAKLIEERTDNLWNAYASGTERDGEWSHNFMSDGEWLARECGLDPGKGWHAAAVVKSRIPEVAARAALQSSEETP
jgi:hypothetical protein